MKCVCVWLGLCSRERIRGMGFINPIGTWLYIVLGGYLHILSVPSVRSCCTLSISASYRVFVYGRYRKSRLVCVLLSDLDLSRHHLPL